MVGKMIEYFNLNDDHQAALGYMVTFWRSGPVATKDNPG
jgi:hypothetical protein